MKQRGPGGGAQLRDARTRDGAARADRALEEEELRQRVTSLDQSEIEIYCFLLRKAGFNKKKNNNKKTTFDDSYSLLLQINDCSL